ncbi:hypothetical protein CF70_021340 [Cupriavidus sp. SK-3]|nr:hypothetical protein CF70_021340 [Cupriavidus sp. SK-3]
MVDSINVSPASASQAGLPVALLQLRDGLHSPTAVRQSSAPPPDRDMLAGHPIPATASSQIIRFRAQGMGSTYRWAHVLHYP